MKKRREENSGLKRNGRKKKELRKRGMKKEMKKLGGWRQAGPIDS